MKSKGLTKRDGKRYMTLIEIAEATGASYRTVAAYAQKAGWTEHGKQTLLDEAQVTIITEAMKMRETGRGFSKREDGSTLHNDLQSIETDQSAAVRVGMLMESIKRQYDEAMKIVAAENAKLKKEKESLAVRLGEAEEWWSVKRVLAETGREYPWRPLVDYAKTRGPAPRKTFDANYGEVNAYHRDTWYDVYGVEL